MAPRATILLLLFAVACSRPPFGTGAASLPAGGAKSEAASEPRAGFGPPAGLGCYLAQLHLHGHSNHNGNALPASMESHSFEAARNGFDVIWWTDHALIYQPYRDLRLDFASARIAESSDKILLGGGLPKRGISALRLSRPKDGGRLTLQGGSLVVRLDGTPGSDAFEAAALTPVSEIGTVRTVTFCRPVTSGLTLDVWARAQGLDRDTYLRFTFDFSWHPKGRHHAIFEAGASRDAPPATSGDTTVTCEFALPDPGEPISLDLERALSAIPHGGDNTLSSFTIEVGARRGGSISVAIDSIVLRSSKPAGENQYESVDALAAEYARELGVDEYVGVEMGKFHLPSLPHMNAYLPDSTRNFATIGLDTGVRRDLWVDEVHRRGGLVSFNHPFGVQRNSAGGRKAAQGQDRESEADAEEYEGDTGGASPRVRAMAGPAATAEQFWAIASPILDHNGLGCDLLEVGYLFRGIGSLDDHLKLWDLALANGVRLVGTGTSDSHGGVWGPDMVPNPFATWIWARSKGADELLRALKAGRVAFGDPFLWKGKFAFGVDGAMMGDTLFIDGPREARAWVSLGAERDDLDIRLVTVQIRQGRDVETTRAEWTPAGAGEMPVHLAGPCFLRAEIYARDGSPLVFSNPVFIIPAK